MTKQEIADDLKEFRKSKDLSRAELADLLGYSPRSIESAEQGRGLGRIGRKSFEELKKKYD